MLDLLTFNSFVTKYILIALYYTLALVVPLMLLLKGVVSLRAYPILRTLLDLVGTKSRLAIAAAIVLFELFLRMFFEMLIGYFDMHDYLHQIVKSAGG